MLGVDSLKPGKINLVVGDGNQVIDDSTVGAAAFGDGDATNVDADNAVLGDGTIVDGGAGDIAFNQGDGDLTQIENSNLSESVVGDGTVQSNDVAITADDGAAVAFGDGSDASGVNTETDIQSGYGDVNVAGDDLDQSTTTDNSLTDSGNISDSGNTSVVYTDNSVDYSDNSVDNSYDVADSGNTTVDYTDASTNDSFNQSDDDGYDIDVSLEAPAEAPIEPV